MHHWLSSRRLGKRGRAAPVGRGGISLPFPPLVLLFYPKKRKEATGTLIKAEGPKTAGSHREQPLCLQDHLGRAVTELSYFF